MPLQTVSRHLDRRKSLITDTSAAVTPLVDIVVVPAIGVKKPQIQQQTLALLSSPGLYGTFLLNDSQPTRVLLLDYPTDDAKSNDGDIISRYATHLLDRLQAERVQRNARHQIHFVGHSTGGLVVKKALVLAQQASHYARIISCCSSIALFGVPHWGSSILSEAPFAESVREQLGLSVEMSSALRKFVAPENDAIRLLYYDFLPIARKMQRIWTFIENEDSVVQALASSYDAGDTRIALRFPIVDARSATLRIGNETVLRMNRRHAELLGPTHTENPNPLDEYLRSLQDLLTLMLRNDDDLDQTIKKSMNVDLHLFYDASQSPDHKSIKVWSVFPSLMTLLDDGPIECFKARLRQPQEPQTSEPVIKPLARAQAINEANLPAAPRYSATRRPSVATIQVTEDQAVSEKQRGDKTEKDIPLIQIRPPTPPPDDMSKSTASQVKSDCADSFAVSRGPDDNSYFHPLRPQESIDALQGPSKRPPDVEASTNELTDSNLSNLKLTVRAGEKDLSREFKDPDFHPFYKERALVTFQLPDRTRRLFRWAHLPCNVMGWVPDVMQSMVRDPERVQALGGESIPSRLYENLLHESNFDAKQNIARHGLPHSRYMLPTCKSYLMLKPDITRMCIFLPYLHWDSFKSLKKRDEVIQRRLRKKQPHPVDSDIRSGSSMEHKLIWQYIHNNSNTPVHHRRSLDQFGYPNLRSTKARDLDQVLYKRRSALPVEVAIPKPAKKRSLADSLGLRPRKNSPKEPQGPVADESGNVLMVDQLWCWVIDNSTVLTLFSPKEGEPEDKDSAGKLADLRDSIYNDVNGDPRFATQCHNVFDFAALVVSHAVKVFMEDMPDDDLQVFRVFEEYISILTEQHTTSFKDFRDRYHAEGAYRALRKHVSSAGEALSKLQEIDLQANEHDLTALLELQDIYDELNTLDKLFREQHGVVSEMLEQYSDGRAKDGLELLRTAKTRIETYRSQVEQMQIQCKTAQGAFTGLLDMKQRQANVAEAWAAREANEVASGQSRAVLIFTIFTIIFLPLSFFTGFFGMNVKIWSSVPSNPALHTVILLMFPVSAAVIIIALLVAFNDYVRHSTLWCFKQAWAAFKRSKHRMDIESRAGLLHRHGRPDIRTGIQLAHSRAGIMAGFHLAPSAQTRLLNPKAE